MAKHIHLSDFGVAEDLFLKKQTVRIGGKSFETPIKAFDASKRRNDITIKDDVTGLNEIFKAFNQENLTEYVKGDRDEGTLNLELDRKKRRTGESETSMCFVGYDSEGYPNEKGIDFLMDLTHEFSDAIPLPYLPKLFENDSRDISDKISDYQAFLQGCIDSVNQLNNKPVLGIIPEAIPSTFIGDLVDFYYNNDITSFVYDFKGKVSVRMRTKIRRMMIALKNLGLLDNSFLYAINANYGRMLKGASIIRAKDVLTFGLGFDSLGDQHIRRSLPSHVWAKMKEKGSGPSIRLFDYPSYGYVKTNDISILEQMYPKNETDIPFQVFEQINNKSIQSQSLFNSERIGFETRKYRELIIEQSDKTLVYFETKQYIDEKDLKGLGLFRRRLEI